MRTARAFADLTAAVEAVLPRILAATRTPGVAVALATSTELCGMGAGYADLARGMPMRGTSTGTAGSLSKPLVGLSLMQHARDGAIEVDEPLDPHLPTTIQGANPSTTTPITPGMLTAHLGGYRTDFIDARLSRPRPIAEHVAERHEIGRTPEYGGVCPLFGPPGTYAYSSLGMSLVACAIEEMTGKPYADGVSRAILEPLGMTGSALPAGTPELCRWDELRASDHHTTGYLGFGPWCVPSPAYHAASYPAAGLITSPVDYARLLQSMLRSANGVQGVVHPDDVAAMLVPRVARSSPVTPDSFAGMGLELSDPQRDGELWWWGHSAAYPWGYWWDARVYPHLDLVVVAMANKWDVMRLHNPADRNAAGIVAQWASRWAASGPPAARITTPAVADRPALGAEASTWMGAMLAERTHGTLGVPGRLDPDVVRAAARETRPFDTAQAAGAETAAFERGVEDVLALAPDPRALQEYARRQGPDAALWALECGATTAEFPVPAPVFSAEHR